MMSSTKFSISLNASVVAALERVAVKHGLDLNEVIQRALADHAWREGELDETTYGELKMMRDLVDRAVQAALDICAREGFRSDITPAAFTRSLSDPGWASGYREFVGDDIYRTGNPRKAMINRQIGLRIRAATGARPRLGPGGRPETVKVTGQVIQSYTPLVRD